MATFVAKLLRKKKCCNFPIINKQNETIKKLHWDIFFQGFGAFKSDILLQILKIMKRLVFSRAIDIQ